LFQANITIDVLHKVKKSTDKLYKVFYAYALVDTLSLLINDLVVVSLTPNTTKQHITLGLGQA